MTENSESSHKDPDEISKPAGGFASGPVAAGFAQQPEKTQDPEANYTRTITERADKIVAALAATNASVAVQVRDLIAQQYRSLRDIHDSRDAAIKTAKGKSTGEKAAVKTAQDEAKAKLEQLHRKFLVELSAHLTPEQAACIVLADAADG